MMMRAARIGDRIMAAMTAGAAIQKQKVASQAARMMSSAAAASSSSCAAAYPGRNRMHVYNPYSSAREKMEQQQQQQISPSAQEGPAIVNTQGNAVTRPGRTALVSVGQTPTSGSGFAGGVLIDTLALLRRFMSAGMSESQAEKIITSVQEVLRTALDAYMVQFVTTDDFGRQMNETETRQEYEIISVKRDNERLRNELEKVDRRRDRMCAHVCVCELSMSEVHRPPRAIPCLSACRLDATSACAEVFSTRSWRAADDVLCLAMFCLCFCDNCMCSSARR